MNTIYDTANQLAKEIQQSEEYMTYKIAKEAINLKNSGVGLSEFRKIYANTDYDGNGRIKKAEAIAYLNSTNYSRAQKRAIFDALIAGTSVKNPY